MGFVATIIHFDEYLSNIGEYYLNNGMEKSPAWEAKSHSASQEIPRLL